MICAQRTFSKQLSEAGTDRRGTSIGKAIAPLSIALLSHQERTMPTAKVHASTILAEFEKAQAELIGAAVVLTDAKAETVENIWLDELHGIRLSIRGTMGNGLWRPSNSWLP
jgi:hypothetical protein